VSQPFEKPVVLAYTKNLQSKKLAKLINDCTTQPSYYKTSNVVYITLERSSPDMRSLSIQIQPDRVPGIDMDRLTQEFLAISKIVALVKHHCFDSGNDSGSYFNFTFGTHNASALWQTIQERIYNSPELGNQMSCASMAMCSGEAGWDSYSQLFHYDHNVQIDKNAL